MAVISRLLPMLAFSTFALFLLALLATPTNAFESIHAHGHSGLAMRKRNAAKLAKRCRPKLDSENDDPASTPAPTTTKFKTATTTLSATRTPTTTSAAQSDVGGGTGSDPNKKLLMAWPGGPAGLDKFKGNNVGGVYSWSPYDPTNGVYPFFPMLWGPKQTDSFAKQVDASKPNYCLGFNEPNHEAQANMSPGDAARLWRDKMEPARSKGCKLVSPAVTSAPSGKTWLQQFFNACQGCNVDYVAVHWYGTKSDQFKSYVTDFYNTFKKPIIVSEYACQDFAGGPQCTNDQT
ncbi:hypothetical protein FRC07_006810, partial [Ceratobasidium sp. 392]